MALSICTFAKEMCRKCIPFVQCMYLLRKHQQQIPWPLWPACLLKFACFVTLKAITSQTANIIATINTSKSKEGIQIFNTLLIAVDLVNYSVAATTTRLLNSSHGHYGEGQQTLEENSNCIVLTFNMHILHTQVTPLALNLNYNSRSTRRECKCHLALSPCFTN